MKTPIEVLALVASTLDRLKIRYTVVGSFASSARGRARATADIDLVADIAPDQVHDLAAALREMQHNPEAS